MTSIALRNRRNGNWLQEGVKALRGGWLVIAVITVVALVIGLAYTLIQTPTYQSTTTLYVSSVPTTTGDRASPEDLQAFATTYAQLATSDEVIAAALRDSSLGLSVSDAAADVTAIATPETTLIEVTATDSDRDVARDLANDVSEALVAFVSADAGRAGPAQMQVVTPATADGSAVSPNLVMNLLWALIFGWMVGVLAALIRASLDTRIRRDDDVSSGLGLPVLGSIAGQGLRSEDPADELVVEGSPAAQSIELLWTNLSFAEDGDLIKSLVVASPSESLPRSTVAVNLAVAAAKSGRSVVLVKADVRGSASGGAGHGLTAVINGSESVEDAVEPKLVGGLSVLGAGPRSSNAAELMRTRRAVQVFEELAAKYDHVIIDAPPILGGSVAAVLAARADGAVIVCHADQTKADELARASDQLLMVRARVLGAVVIHAVRGRFWSLSKT